MPAMVDSKLVKADESQKASGATGSEKQSQSGVPVPVNAMNRPPSTTTVTSTASNGAQRTTTSRRGGRTRSRSPPAMGNRLAGPSEPMPPSSLGDNPSSAAAAAAAAAKAFSSSGGGRNPNTWSEAGPREDPAFHAHAHAGYDKPYSSSSNWPGEEGPGAHAYGASHRYQGGAYGEEYRQESGGQYRRPEEAPPGYHDRRYREAPRGHAYEGERGPRPPPPPQHAGGHYPTDFRYTQGRDTRSPPKGQRSGGGTTLVIGTSKPIHVPKTPSGPPERKSRGGSTLSSVFRGRPGDDTGRAAPQDDDVDSPQKILLSLRTPTTSFEEKADKGKKGSGPPLSPDDPPQIQNSHPADQLFEPQRSPDVLKNVGSLEMAPSFNLFNQSFDSFGDAQYFNVDSTLQNDSFGMVRTGSIENDGTTQLLQGASSSGGNFAQQVLNGSGSGALTIGYSPVNSFGTATAGMAPRRPGGNMMVLGGSDARASSPTQVLGMYRSYSGSGPRPGPGPPSGPLDDSHLRMSVGSFGSQQMQPYGRPYGDPAASPYYNYNMAPSRCSHESSDGSTPFYTLLRKYKNAFKDCTFLLPGLKAALLESPLSDRKGADGSNPAIKAMPSQPPYMGSGGPGMFSEPTLQDVAVARRRIDSSVCVFGGHLNRDRTAHGEKMPGNQTTLKGAGSHATVTPSSSVGTPPGSRFHSRSKKQYEEGLPGRYYESESRLSWEFEETPPIEIGREDEEKDNDGKTGASSDDKSRSDDQYCKQIDGDYAGKPSSPSPAPKMRYRCKLCGQPKQNHNCPYQQSLARSIGVNVYPAVNAFSAAEPGTIAPALSEMNNFVDQKEASSNESSPSRPTPERVRVAVPTTTEEKASTQVTPESMRSSPRSPSSPSLTPGTPARTPRSRNGLGRRGNKKRGYSEMKQGSTDQGDLLFIESMELKPEQFRIVTPPKFKSPDAYTYPSLPLPYAQRKRLSDNLFSLSNEIPKLTDECAQVLREAREKNMWDLAVSELMTQVVVIIHCPDGDHRFEGLRQYLLTLGVAC